MKKFRNLFIAICLSLSLMTINFVKVDAASSVEMRIYSKYETTAMHSWLVFRNNSSSNVYVGNYYLKSCLSVTVGTWGNLNEHSGIWYNVEGWKDMTGISIGMNLSTSQLATVNSKINSSNTWSYLNNCSSFVVKVWNSVSSSTVSAGIPNLPSQLYSSIRNKSGSTAYGYMPSNGSGDIYYHSGNTTVQTKPTGTGSSSSSSFSTERNPLKEIYGLDVKFYEI